MHCNASSVKGGLGVASVPGSLLKSQGPRQAGGMGRGERRVALALFPVIACRGGGGMESEMDWERG